MAGQGADLRMVARVSPSLGSLAPSQAADMLICTHNFVFAERISMSYRAACGTTWRVR
jgi:hypothetical protein